MFSWLAAAGPVAAAAALRAGLGLAERPADVPLTYCAALGLIERDLAAADRIMLTEVARRHLVGGAPHDLRAYYASLAERPAVQELATVLRTGTCADDGTTVRPRDVSPSPPCALLSQA